jgi:hypothetical protein
MDNSRKIAIKVRELGYSNRTRDQRSTHMRKGMAPRLHDWILHRHRNGALRAAPSGSGLDVGSAQDVIGTYH